jgi:hypothetical protein
MLVLNPTEVECRTSRHRMQKVVFKEKKNIRVQQRPGGFSKKRKEKHLYSYGWV